MIALAMESSVVCVMVAELAGAATLRERHGDEAGDRARAARLGVIRSALAEHGGREAGATHDELTAAFPSAVAAVRCAVALQAELAGVRIGLDAGEPAWDGGEPIGTTVIVARELCRVAEPGDILVSDVVRHIAAARHTGRIEPAGAFKLRGVAERVTAWRVLPGAETAETPPVADAVTVVVADDERLLRAGFRVILEAEPDLQVVGEAADGLAAVDVVRRAAARRRADGRPHAGARRARRRRSASSPTPSCRPRVVMLTTFDVTSTSTRRCAIGASGFLLKDAPAERLIAADPGGRRRATRCSRRRSRAD